MSQVQNERKLIKAAQQGNLDAFNALVLAYQSQVFDLVYQILGGSLAPSQVTQEVFIAAFHTLPRYGAGSFRVWLLSRAVGACHAELARGKRSKGQSPEVAHSDGLGLPAGAKNGGGSPEGAGVHGVLSHALQALPEEQRVALVLSDVHGCDYQEIAEITQESVSTIRRRLSQARGKIRDFLLHQRAL